MHNDIAEFPKKHFYNNDLVEFSDSQRREMVDYSGFNKQPLNIIVSSSRIVFVPSKPDYRSKINEEEAVLTARLIDHIAMISGSKFDPGKTVGVITPFRAQIATIRNCLMGKYKDVTIDTVERFQGSERDIIILSFAVKSTAQLKTIQSINDGGVDRKLNVAITRAKEQLIMLGVEEVLRKNGIFSNLIDFVKSKGGYLINPLKTDSLPNNLF
jgi:superfamily I DNA and/or RNA helicase